MVDMHRSLEKSISGKDSRETDVREKNWRNLKIKEERRELLPPLSEAEKDELRESIREGYWDSEPIIVDQDGYIVDGHNRFEICKEEGVESNWKVRDFGSEEEIQEFIIRKQISRRNLNNFQKVELAEKFSEVESEKAKERMRQGGKGSQNFGDLSKGRANGKIGDRIGLSRETVRKGRKILDDGSDELIKDCRNGDKSIHSAYNEIQDNIDTGGQDKDSKSPGSKDNDPKFIWLNKSGDVAFAEEWEFGILIGICYNNPESTFFLESKNPDIFLEYEEKTGFKYPDNLILATTIETNREGHTNSISEAPKPEKRYEDMKNLDHPRKALTIEPILEFDKEVLLTWIEEIYPERIWIGFNSKPEENDLEEIEPSYEEAEDLYVELEEKGNEVVAKGNDRLRAYLGLPPHEGNQYPELVRGIPPIFVGCRFECSYCKPSYQRNMKRQKHNCELCYDYEPHIHLERIRRT